jgi:serine phosphatase RsbU (regulator of sigma subunit)
MCPLFQSRAPHPLPAIEPVPSEFPKINGAEIAAATYGQRVAGDFYDSLRVSPERILFGLLDVAGRRDTNQQILSAAQNIFRTLGTELFSGPDINESDAMTELCLRLNRGLMEAAAGVHSCPAFIGCYHEQFGTLCYTNAGHTPGLLRDSTGIAELGSTGCRSVFSPTPLATLPSSAWRKVRFFCWFRGGRRRQVQRGQSR